MDFVRHRWTGRYEAHLWDNSCRKEGQTRKGRQGEKNMLFGFFLFYTILFGLLSLTKGRPFSKNQNKSFNLFPFLFHFLLSSCFEREYTNDLFHALVGFFKSTQFTLVSYTPSHALVVSLYSFTIFVNLFPLLYNTVTG